MIKSNKRSFLSPAVYGGIFLFMLVCNYWTPLMVDDFYYAFSYATRERITSVAQIFPSMAEHAAVLNGRLVAHGLVQFSLIFPVWVFDIVNAGIFTGIIFMICKITCRSKQYRALMPFLVFCAMWKLELVFGQANLWQDGAINYLWANFFCMIYLLPFIQKFLGTRELKGRILPILYIAESFIAGAFNEAGSAAFIGMSIIFLILIRFVKKEKLSPVYLIAAAAAILGYISIYLAPSEMGAKAGGGGLGEFVKNFINCTMMLQNFSALLIAYLVLTVLTLREKCDKDRILMAAVFFLGALMANYILAFARWYPERVAVSAATLLIMADAVLLYELLCGRKCLDLITCGAAVLVAATIFSMVPGVCDIYRNHKVFKRNEAWIQTSLAEGNTNVLIENYIPETPYCGSYDMPRPSDSDWDMWVNRGMRWYYGADSILAKKN